ncbi:hypothetical protein OH76DRAFT_1488134 [Lentinus brumalis]|uniref:Uncharacterized protein n=1 Tax=Lentinus brumalis TaxID=2498619 RepID=A0A371CS75_9APHY|nr:hypothetical protein OH76DRAFT_1488134 [Polyporus brumalis]
MSTPPDVLETGDQQLPMQVDDDVLGDAAAQLRPTTPESVIDVYEHGSWSQGHTPPRYRSLTRATRPPETRILLSRATDPWSDEYDEQSEAILTGIRYANGQPPSDCPIIQRTMPSFDISDVVEPLHWPSTEREEATFQQFMGAWRDLAREQRPPGMNRRAIEGEQQFLLSLLTASVPEMAKAVASRQVGVQRDIVHTMRTLIDGLEMLREVEEMVRYECMDVHE